MAEALGDPFAAAPDGTVKRAMLIRGIIHLLVTDLITASRASIERWLTQRRIATPADFRANRRKLPASLVAPSKTGDRLYRELKEFIYQRIIHSHRVSQHDERAHLVLVTLFSAYYRNPRLLPDDVLLRYRDLAGVAYLRDIPLKRLETEIAGNYLKKPLFLRSITDYLAGMTDSYALGEYDTMVSAYPRRRAGSPD